jgi:conjugal transfer pilus assembly protein TraD
MPATTTDPLAPLDHLLILCSVVTCMIAAGGFGIALLVRVRGLRWTWIGLAAPVPLIALAINELFGIGLLLMLLIAGALAAHWHTTAIDSGGDLAEAAEARPGPVTTLRDHRVRGEQEHPGIVEGERLIVGVDERGLPLWVPVGYDSGFHCFIPGATGAGKSTTMRWIMGNLIPVGFAAIKLTGKDDPLLEATMRHAADQAGRPFHVWSPDGPCAYNPYAHGDDSEIADKALAGEQFTEPHYLRQAQRYLGHAVRTMRAARITVTPITLTAHLEPAQLEATSRRLHDQAAAVVQAYLDSLTDRQRRELAGVRDRLSILAESDLARWLDPTTTTNVIDLHECVRQGAVVYFRLDADRHPLLAKMIAAAIIGDLVTLSAHLQTKPIPTLLSIDEFASIAGPEVARLFATGRSAGISLLLATQELADLSAVGDGALRQQVLGNVAAIIAHRQNVPDSAEEIASIAGTKPAWITTQQTESLIFTSTQSGRGSRRRGHEYIIHPDRIKELPTGHAAVITPGTGQTARVARIYHPDHIAAGKRLWTPDNHTA